jgi:hypothetical protein
VGGDEATLAVPASIDVKDRARALASLGIEDPPAFPAPPRPQPMPPPMPGPRAQPPMSSGVQPAWGHAPPAPPANHGFAAPPPPPRAAPFGPFPMTPQSAQPPPVPPPPWEQAERRPSSGPLSSQIIILAVVGVICLGIFATGIYLFVTTKF